VDRPSLRDALYHFDELVAVGAPPLSIAAGVADIHREPDPDAEVITQALLNMPAIPRERSGEWTRVWLRDYEGWIRSGALAAPAQSSARIAVVHAPRTSIATEMAGSPSMLAAFATTILPTLDGAPEGSVRVALPGGGSGWVPAADVTLRPAEEPFPQAGPEVAIGLARQLLGTPYMWGGVSADGLDCSGFVQLCCRTAGRAILRDADQQYESISYVVERGALQAGDLLFFARGGAITHVGMMLNSARYIHAKGGPESCVMLNSLDPAREDFSARLADMYAGARRPFASAPRLRHDGAGS
jgi:cell wall-associated NlpC family hydrolase